MAVIVPPAWFWMLSDPAPSEPEPAMVLFTLTRTPSLKPVTSRIRLLALLVSATVPPPVSVTVVRLMRRSVLLVVAPRVSVPWLLIALPTVSVVPLPMVTALPATGPMARVPVALGVVVVAVWPLLTTASLAAVGTPALQLAGLFQLPPGPV